MDEREGWKVIGMEDRGLTLGSLGHLDLEIIATVVFLI